MKKLFIHYWIKLLLAINIVNCESFCDSGKTGRMDTAFTYSDKTYLIRNNNVWSFDVNEKMVSSESMTVEDLFTKNMSQTLGRIQTIFANNSEMRPILYIFKNQSKSSKYYLMEPQTEQSNPSFPVTFTQLSGPKKENLNEKWQKNGENIDDWFPSNIDESVVVNGNQIYLFYGKQIRFTNITKNWPSGEKIDYTFTVRSESKSNGIDAAFSLPKSEIVIVVGLQYCSFKINDSNIANSINSCVWNESQYYFRCSADTIEIEVSENVTQTSSEATVYGQKDRKPRNNYFISIVLIVIFSLILLMSLFISICYVVYKKYVTTTTESTQGKNEVSVSNERSMSSIHTLNSDTGERASSNKTNQ